MERIYFQISSNIPSFRNALLQKYWCYECLANENGIVCSEREGLWMLYNERIFGLLYCCYPERNNDRIGSKFNGKYYIYGINRNLKNGQMNIDKIHQHIIYNRLCFVMFYLYDSLYTLSFISWSNKSHTHHHNHTANIHSIHKDAGNVTLLLEF